ncbi:MAG: sigma-70 family RNA polymerase sigma factor [Propionibacteriales bacterium]|nr:sigma-70 family RNA polymerase sigma factor [Propionibacteriales bacterium]
MPDVSTNVPLSPRAERAADAALVAGLAIDDPAAATAFVRRFQGRVFGLALAVTRDPALAEDVAQEAFVRAWRAAPTYDAGRASVGTWLLTITRNAAIDATRARRSTPMDRPIIEELLQETLSGGDAAEAALNRIEFSHAAQRLLAIPREQARAVVLAVVAGCSAAEVSEHEQIPLGTAKTRIRTGLRKLREAMREETRD